jgi:hypothetical protein
MNMPGSSNKSSKGVWIAIGVVVVIALVLIFSIKKSEPVVPVDNTPVVEQPTDNNSGDVGVNQEDANSPAVSLSYTAAMKKYANARMQINASCVIPSPYVNLTFKVGSSVMLDNRSNESHSVLFNGTRYTLGAYGFRIVTLNTVKKFMVDCDKSQNVATVTVQK